MALKLIKERKLPSKRQRTGLILQYLLYFYTSDLLVLSSYKYQSSGSWPHPGPWECQLQSRLYTLASTS